MYGRGDYSQNTHQFHDGFLIGLVFKPRFLQESISEISDSPARSLGLGGPRAASADAHSGTDGQLLSSYHHPSFPAQCASR